MAVDGSPGPRGRCWVTSSERKEDLKTQSAHFRTGQNEATGAMPALARHTWLELIAFLPLLPACGQSFPRWILVWKQKAAWRRVGKSWSPSGFYPLVTSFTVASGFRMSLFPPRRCLAHSNLGKFMPWLRCSPLRIGRHCPLPLAHSRTSQTPSSI